MTDRQTDKLTASYNPSACMLKVNDMDEDDMCVEELSVRSLSVDECQENTDTEDLGLDVEIGEQRSIELDDEDDDVVDEEDEMENDDIVCEVVSAVARNRSDVEIELTVSDMCENRLVSEFVEKGCACALLKDQQCSQQFSLDYIADVHSHYASLSRDKHDMAILGQLLPTLTSAVLLSLNLDIHVRIITANTCMVANRFSEQCFSFSYYRKNNAQPSHS